ncbi:MAG: DUF429 domain-containing protein [Cyanobacteria bacterium REEB67]|nr:DUF429 domain-containing protein [Cyanobacteria bacterium REEB67]
MTATTIIGADYSAARSDPNPTWLAAGRFEGAALVIYKLENVGSARLAAELLILKNSSQTLAAGLDFPFSWPQAFLDWARRSGRSLEQTDFEQMEALAALYRLEMGKETYKKMGKEMGKEPRRRTDDLIRPRAQSPLHRINPGMLKMTWQGGRLLNELRGGGFMIAPFDGAPSVKAREAAEPGEKAGAKAGEKAGANATKSHPYWAFEVYPAATLLALSLPCQKYKGRSAEAIALREMILEALQAPAALNKLHTLTSGAKTLPGLSFAPNAATNLLDLARCSDDALDALLACYSTALALLFPALTGPGSILPDDETASAAAAEGWIYSPYSPLVKI